MRRAQRTAPLGADPHTTRDVVHQAPSGRGESEVTPRECRSDDLSTCLDRARIRLGVQVKEIAYWWKTDHGYVSRVLSNKDPLPDHRFTELPLELQRATLEEWGRDLGITVGRKADLTKALQALARLADDDPLNVPVRMAKASLSENGQ